MTGATTFASRSGKARLIVVLLAGLLAACASPSSGLDVGSVVVPGRPCDATATRPEIVSTSAAALPPSTYDRAIGWESSISFRVDDQGVPVDIRTTVADGLADADAIVAVSSTAFAGYRFCAPVAYSSQTRWVAALRFRPVVSARATRDSDMFVQMLVPAYTGEDLREHRTGTVRVAGTFAEDGRPRRLRLVASSGDAALDRKSLDAMATWQLVFRPGTEPKHPIVFEQPYTYAIQ